MEKDAKTILNWKEIGQRFKEVRTSRSLGQIELVRKAQAFKDAIYKYEAGVAPASTNYALFLRNEFGVSFDWLYDGVEIDIEYEDKIKKRILNPQDIGERLKAIRIDKGMSQKQFAGWIGITSQNISDYERGVQKPEIKTALKIKRALNKPLDWIYFGDRCITTNNKPYIPTTTNYIPPKQIKKELKEEVMHRVKSMDSSELALLATRLRMEQQQSTLRNCTADESIHNTTQHKCSSEKRKSQAKVVSLAQVLFILRQYLSPIINWLGGCADEMDKLDTKCVFSVNTRIYWFPYLGYYANLSVFSKESTYR